jgi:MinD superfamily P-loop ATPase
VGVRRVSSGALTVAVASGKGGTGKTMVATNLAALVARLGRRTVLADCDVDAPNDHLFFPAEMRWRELELPRPEIDLQACRAGCRRCRDACRFGAIRILAGRPVLFGELCHGCGACARACPAGAITERPHRIGRLGLAQVEIGLTLVSGVMDVGEAEAPALVRATRALAESERAEVAILDAPPGAACSVVASVRGVDLLLLVTEPTRFGLHDLELALRLGRALELPMAVALNRDGSGSADIVGACARAGVPLVARIPFEREIAEIYAEGRLLVDAHPRGQDWFSRIWAAAERLAPALTRKSAA